MRGYKLRKNKERVKMNIQMRWYKYKNWNVR